MAKTTTTSKQSKKPVTDCHCNESKNAKSKSSKSSKACDCAKGE